MTTKQGSANNKTERTAPDFRPKALRYAEHTREIEQMIMDVLPDIVRKLSSMALEGNMAAAKYLMDRIHGRPTELAAAPSTDTSLTFDHHQWHRTNWSRNRSTTTAATSLFGPSTSARPNCRPAGNVSWREETSPQPSPWKGEGLRVSDRAWQWSTSRRHSAIHFATSPIDSPNWSATSRRKNVPPATFRPLANPASACIAPRRPLLAIDSR